MSRVENRTGPLLGRGRTGSFSGVNDRWEHPHSIAYQWFWAVSASGESGRRRTSTPLNATTNHQFGGFQGCDALDQAGVARISGLAALLPPVSAWLGNATAVAALSASARCPLVGPVRGEGDILLGGAGSDTFTGRAGNDIIDGDKSLEVHITVRTDPAVATSEIGRTDLMANVATSGHFGPGTTGMTLQQAVFAALVDPATWSQSGRSSARPSRPQTAGRRCR